MGQRVAAVGDVGVSPGFWDGRRVLLTGNTGFKGAWLTLWLLELGATVVGLSDAVPTEPSLFRLADLDSYVDQRWVDVRDASGVAGVVADGRPEVVIHMAAQPFVRRSFAEPVETYATNVMGTVNVLDAVRRTPDGVGVVVNVTTDKCYENREWEWAYREDESMGGHDPYSSSKGAAELVTAGFRSSYFDDPSGPRVATARAGNVIGGGDWGEDRLIPDIMRGALSGQTVAIRRPDAVRPWQHVLNPLSGYLQLVEALWNDPMHATAFNFGPADSDARPVEWIVERLRDRWDGELSTDVDAGPHLHEATWLKLDSSRARTRLGWEPRWDLGRAIDEIVDWYRVYRDGGDVQECSRAQIAAFNTTTDPLV